MDVTTIVAGYDGSDGSTAAVAWALCAAVRTGAAVELLHADDARPTVPTAHPRSAGSPTHRHPDRTHDTALAAMLDAAVAAAAQVQPQVTVTTRVAAGPAAAVLRDRSESTALLVVGAHGHRRCPGPPLPGSVALTTAGYAFCPVVVVPTVDDPGTPRQGIVVGYDGSAAADLALGFAFDEATVRAAPLRVVRAWWPPMPAWKPLAWPPRPPAAEHDLLSAELSPWRQKYPAVAVSAEVVPGHPAHVLTSAGRSAALLVLGFRGVGGFPGLRLGSVAGRVVLAGAGPTAVVRAAPAVTW